MGNVKDRYLFLSAAGDEYVGRTVAGLPSDSSEFSILPPHFADPADDVVVNAIKTVFPSIHNHDGVRFVLPFLLASLVYHYDFLDTTLAADHRIRTTPLFLSTSIVEDLKPLVLCGLDSPVLTPTGIPSTVKILRKCDAMLAKVTAQNEALEQRVIETLEDAAVSAGAVTNKSLEAMLPGIINSTLELGYRSMPLPLPCTCAASAVTPAKVVALRTAGALHTWG